MTVRRYYRNGFETAQTADSWRWKIGEIRCFGDAGVHAVNAVRGSLSTASEERAIF
jgi:hypothetical protein